MITETALHIAGPDALLVARPTSDVAHVYVGPLTRSGRFAAASGRPVCRARTRRLSVLPERPSSLAPREPGSARLCARCSARLAATPAARRASTPCIHRTDYAHRYAGLTRRDFYYQALAAETLDELEHVAHLSLVVLGHRECEKPLPVHHEDATGHTLTALIGHLRERLADYPNRDRAEAFTALLETGYAQAKADRKATWQEREDRITRLGFNNATARN